MALTTFPVTVTEMNSLFRHKLLELHFNVHLRTISDYILII